MANATKEIGRTGQRRYGGVFYEEFLPELRGRRGVEMYREMADNDDIVGAVLFAIKMLVKQAAWNVEPGGASAKDTEAAEFVRGCMDDMQTTWIETISEILSFLTYGWSLHEIVYKRRMGRTKDPRTRSRYTDGLIGWRKLPVRGQETLYQWEYDEEDKLIGMTQQPPPSFGLITIPMEKALLFRTENRKDNPEGRSILRSAYRSWYFKKYIQELEGIGVERDFAGMPVITAPPDVPVWDEQNPEMVRTYATLEAMVKNIRRDQSSGIVLQNGYELKLLTTGGARQFDTNKIITRYDTAIAKTVMADFLQLGHEQVGSFALSSDKTKLFAVAIGTYLDIICETFNSKAIPDLIDINGEHFKGITDYPRLTHGDIEDVNLTELSTFIKDMVGIGALIPDDTLEDFIRQSGHLPDRIEERRDEDETRRQQRTQNTAGGTVDPGAEELTAEETEAAKRRLGRGAEA